MTYPGNLQLEGISIKHIAKKCAASSGTSGIGRPRTC